MQITRQRVRPAVEVNVTEVCPTCLGKGRVQPSILFTDQVEEEIEHMREHFKEGTLTLSLHPYVFSYVTRGWFNSLAKQWKRRFGVMENQSLGMLEMRFADANGKTLSPIIEEPTKDSVEAKKK